MPAFFRKLPGDGRINAVAKVYRMLGRVRRGAEWMRESGGRYSTGALLHCALLQRRYRRWALRRRAAVSASGTVTTKRFAFLRSTSIASPARTTTPTRSCVSHR